MSSESSGADYLRRLKQDQERPAAPSGQVVTSLPAESTGSEERRRSPRYKCEGSAEFQEGGTDVRTWGTFTDLSLNGC